MSFAVHKTHPLYQRWKAMRSRCLNANRRDSRWYHDKGVKVCEEWNSFGSFVTWFAGEWDSVKDRYDGMKWGDMEVDRIDGNGNYSPDNCRLVTHLENCRNSKRRKKK